MFHTPHDRLFKGIVSKSRYAQGLLRTALPGAIAKHIDFRTLRLQDGTYVDETLDMRHSDLLFSARIAGRDTRLYVLFEHQSEPDVLMPARLLGYMCGIWTKYIEEHPNTKKLPVILPVVLHHGKNGWTAARSLEELYDLPAELMSAFGAFLPRFTFVLDDLAAQTDQDIRQRAMGAIPTLFMWLLKHGRDSHLDSDGFVEAARPQADLFIKAHSARSASALAMMMRYILEVTGVEPEAFAQFLETETSSNVYEVLMTAAEKLRQEGFDSGVAQGMAQGIEKGRRAMLVRLFEFRFGPSVPSWVLARIERANAAQIDLWTRRILTVETIEEVFA